MKRVFQQQKQLVKFSSSSKEKLLHETKVTNQQQVVTYLSSALDNFHLHPFSRILNKLFQEHTQKVEHKSEAEMERFFIHFTVKCCSLTHTVNI